MTEAEQEKEEFSPEELAMAQAFGDCLDETTSPKDHPNLKELLAFAQLANLAREAIPSPLQGPSAPSRCRSRKHLPRSRQSWQFAIAAVVLLGGFVGQFAQPKIQPWMALQLPVRAAVPRQLWRRKFRPKRPQIRPFRFPVRPTLHARSAATLWKQAAKRRRKKAWTLYQARRS
jgi:hypothetical protein